MIRLFVSVIDVSVSFHRNGPFYANTYLEISHDVKSSSERWRIRSEAALRDQTAPPKAVAKPESGRDRAQRPARFDSVGLVLEAGREVEMVVRVDRGAVVAGAGGVGDLFLDRGAGGGVVIVKAVRRAAGMTKARAKVKKTAMMVGITSG